MNPNDDVVQFARESSWQGFPDQVRHQAKRCLLDTLGALLAGAETPPGRLMARVARSQYGGDEATILVDGSRASAAGAVLANGFAGNALDIDDGYRLIKGHPGACVLPVLLAAAELAASEHAAFKPGSKVAPEAALASSPGPTSKPALETAFGSVPGCTGVEFLTALVVGYELGIRAGRIRHATYACYHSSGSWGAVAGAAAAGRLLGLDGPTLRHAMGAAEYHAPIAPMMKGIAVPSMGKDSIGWGAMVAMLSVLMAREGFTGIEPLFADAPDPQWIKGLGSDWQMLQVYFKPHAACRWSQPAVEATLKVQREHHLPVEAIQAIRIRTFEAAGALSLKPPRNTEEAQYNMAFPVAAALVDGEVGPRQVLPPRLFDPALLDLTARISTETDPDCEAAFPAKTFAEVIVETRDGRSFSSGRMEPRWEPPDGLPTDAELEAKFRWLVIPALGPEASERLLDRVWHLDREPDVLPLIRDACRAPGSQQSIIGHSPMD